MKTKRYHETTVDYEIEQRVIGVWWRAHSHVTLADARHSVKAMRAMRPERPARIIKRTATVTREVVK